jgi:hypothetical protein
VASKDDQLWDEVSALLGGRPHWRVEQSPTPGMPPSWCFEAHGEVDLAVSIDSGAISVYLMNQDRDVTLASIEDLRAWLDANQNAAVNESFDAGQAVDELMHGQIDKWGTRGG